MDEQQDRLVAEVLKSRKYTFIAPNLVARIAREELDKGRRYKETVKAVKNKLHQVGGAYLTASLDYDSWLGELQQTETPEMFKKVCRMVMGKHTSTRERLPFLEEFFSQIFSHLPPITSLLDVACGLNPLAIPWMPLQGGTKYYACDMYADMVSFVGGCMQLMAVDGHAEVCDVVSLPPSTPVDLALVLKTIPCLEQIDKHAGTRLLDGLNARFLVLSFPAKSLGGRSKGMVENYGTRFQELIAGRSWTVLARLEFETELVFVVES